MKKKIIFLSLFCLLLSGCQNGTIPNTIDVSEGTNEIIESNVNSQEINNESHSSDEASAIGGQASVAVDGVRHEMYYAIEMSFIEHFIGIDEYQNNFLPLFGNTRDKNYRGLCEYYGITKEEYIEFWENMREDFNNSYLSEGIDFEKLFPIETKYDEWFSDDYETNSAFMASNGNYTINDNIITEKNVFQTYIANTRNEKHTIRYYTIDSKLIEYVGANRFTEYLKSTNDVNIMTFIEYFDIDKEEYLKIYEDDVLYPYNPDQLFSEDSVSVCFEVQVSKKVTK